jgi:hypothetical protein
MKPSEEIAQLKQESQKLTEQVDGLKKRLAEMETQKPKSKSRQQAEQGLEMLKAGPVTREQFAKLNPKYPSDVVYYIKSIFKIDVKTVRTENGTVHMTPEHHAVYLEGLKKEAEQKKAAADAAKAETAPKEAPRQAQPQVSSAVASMNGIGSYQSMLRALADRRTVVLSLLRQLNLQNVNESQLRNLVRQCGTWVVRLRLLLWFLLWRLRPYSCF